MPDEPVYETTKVTTIGGRFVAANTGDNGNPLDPERYDFSRSAEAPPMPLLPGQLPAQARYDEWGTTNWAVRMRRFDRREPIHDLSYTDAWARLRRTVLQEFQTSLEVRPSDWFEEEPWYEWLWFGGFEDGTAKLTEALFEHQGPGTPVTVAERLRAECTLDATSSWATNGFGGATATAAEWMQTEDYDLSTLDAVKDTMARVMAHSINNAPPNDEGQRIGGQIRLAVASREGVATTGMYERGEWLGV